MKHRITRLSPHQNGKTFGIISAICSLVFVIPFFLLGTMFGGMRTGGAPTWLVFLVPIFYLIAGYIGTAIACWIYNLLIPLTGGIEYETSDTP